jgi:DNA polymerase II small subunit
MTDLVLIKKKVVQLFIKNDVLLSPDFLQELSDTQDLNEIMVKTLEKVNSENLPIDKEKLKGIFFSSEEIKTDPNLKATVKIKFDYTKESKKRCVQDFVAHFNKRYKALRSILMQRQELQDAVSIRRLSEKQEREKVCTIGMISEIHETTNKHLMLTIEDPTGFIKVLINKDSDLVPLGKELVPDEVIGVVGQSGNKIVFANSIAFPDVPITKELKKAPEEVYSCFIGDLHFGSKEFLTEEFEKLLSFLRCELGNETQKAIASKIRYVFLSGDLVDGVGIYPKQENDLVITDIYEQYKIVADYLKKIPNYIKIIICPGNHDAMRIAEPQPKLYKDFAAPIYELENVILVSNPATVNIHSSDQFPGFDVMLYHGFSLIYYADKVAPIRELGGQKRVDLIMKLYLQKRHLAPTHTSTLYLPDADKDYLVIESVPDFLVTGHIHRVTATNYRNVTMLNCSGWLKETDYQVKVGLIPEPARAILVNLKTRKAKIMNFLKNE